TLSLSPLFRAPPTWPAARAARPRGRLTRLPLPPWQIIRLMGALAGAAGIPPERGPAHPHPASPYRRPAAFPAPHERSRPARPPPARASPNGPASLTGPGRYRRGAPLPWPALPWPAAVPL